MLTICLTPTGDRPESLALSKFYYERAKSYYLQNNGDSLEWWVVDDGITPFDPGGCKYLRRQPDGPNSLGRNLSYAFESGVLEAEQILMWEDDDWYASTRIHNQARQLNRWTLHGYSQSIYYHLGLQGYFQHENFQHSSLFETAMRRETAQAFKAVIDSNINEPFLDLLLWKRVQGKLHPHCGEAIGIKGAKGRPGLGSGHNDTKLNYVPRPLQELIGVDTEKYIFKGTVGLPKVGSENVAAERMVEIRHLSEMWLRSHEVVPKR